MLARPHLRREWLRRSSRLIHAEGRPLLAQVPVISIIDDDASIRGALQRFLRALGYLAHAFASAEDFLRSPQVADNSCLILDVRMPEMSGLELQKQPDHFHHVGPRPKHPHAGFECRGCLRPHQAVRDTDLDQAPGRRLEEASNRSHNGGSNCCTAKVNKGAGGCRAHRSICFRIKPRYLFPNQRAVPDATSVEWRR